MPTSHLFARILTLALLVAPSLASAAAAKPTKPNIILIYTDDHGYADLGCQGIMQDVKTPHIDSLASAGARMTAGYVTAPQCGPSRCGVITGQYQNRFGMESNGSFKEDPASLTRFRALKNLPQRLKAVGYATGMAGKSHLGTDDSGELGQLGFDKAFFKHSNGPGHWNMDLAGQDLPPQEQKGGDYHLEQIATFACSFIERYKAQPFFFYLAFRGPHVPLDAPKKYLDRFPGPMPDERRKALGALSCIDDGVGRIMEALKKNGLAENTLIFLIGDNGAPLKSMPLEFVTSPGSPLKLLKPGSPSNWPSWDGSLNVPMNGEKGMLTEGGIRVPFVVHWPGTIPGGQVYAQPVISLDVAATANALAGLPADPALDGVNLIPYLTGQKSGAPHDVLYWRWVGQFAIRRGDWKYLASGDRQYLFNLADDPSEQHNLLAKNPALARDLRAQLEKWSQGLIPAGLVPTTMSVPGRQYFDHYLDGKPANRSAPTEDDDAPKKRRRPKDKAAD